MAAPFSRTLRAHESDRGRLFWALAFCGAALLVGWLAWSMVAEIPVYAVSASARLETDLRAQPVKSRVAGRVQASHLELSREVAAGELLVELEADDLKVALDEKRSKLAALDIEQGSARAELASEHRALEELKSGAGSAVEQAKARRRQAATASRQAVDVLRRTRVLHASGGVSTAELTFASSDARARAAEETALALAIDRVHNDEQVRELKQRIEILKLERALAGLESNRATLAAETRLLEQELAERTIRAPAAGTLGQVTNLSVGSLVAAGDLLATVVPPGALRAVADFFPADAVGRVRPGQSARLRFDGFPPMYFGYLDAEVISVGSEAHDGKVRVELRVSPGPTLKIPLGHGLPGAAEVEIERLSPAAFALRAAGAQLAGASRAVEGGR